MKIIPRYITTATSVLLFGFASQAVALEFSHVITLALRATAESVPRERGPNITVVPISSRITSRDVIEAIGESAQIAFGSRAQLILIRHDAGEPNETFDVVIREPGFDDFNINDSFGFTFGSPVTYGTFNTVTGRDRSTLLYIGLLNLVIDGRTDLSLSGPTTEKQNSTRINGSEVNTGLTSFSAKLAGDGFVIDNGDIFVVVDGTMTVGAGKSPL